MSIEGPLLEIDVVCCVCEWLGGLSDRMSLKVDLLNFWGDTLRMSSTRRRG